MYPQVQSLNTADVWQIVTILPSAWPPGELCTGNTSVCIQNLYNISSGPQPSRSATLLNVSQSLVFFYFFGWLEPSSCGAAVRVLFHRFTHTHTDGANPWCAPATFIQTASASWAGWNQRRTQTKKTVKKNKKQTHRRISTTDTSVHSVSGQTTDSLLSSLLSSLSVFFSVWNYNWVRWHNKPTADQVRV